MQHQAENDAQFWESAYNTISQYCDTQTEIIINQRLYLMRDKVERDAYLTQLQNLKDAQMRFLKMSGQLRLKDDPPN